MQICVYLSCKLVAMENILLLSQRKIKQVSFKFKRYLYDEINSNLRLIAIKGARGVGKTTLLLQLASSFAKEKKVLYVSMDDLFFNNTTLYRLAEDFHKIGGSVLFLDEVHKYPNWSREIKLIYDDFEDLKIIFTSSSILEIFKSESDLSRRLVSYDLDELSLREFVKFDNGIDLPKLALEELLNRHNEIALDLVNLIKPIVQFQNYLRYGCYPYFKENVESYHQKLMQTINLTIDIDLPSLQHIDYIHISKLKRLMYIIATSVPFIPNISKLSELSNMSRSALVHALENLEKSKLIQLLHKETQGIGVLRKPDKLYLQNTNLIYAIAESNANVGNLRETFFLNQLKMKHSVTLADKGDFKVDDMFVFEVGGRNKSNTQIKEIRNAYVVKDDLEVGINNTIPLWLFGLLY